MTANSIPSLLGLPEELRMMIWTLVVPERMVKCFRITSHIIRTGSFYGNGTLWCTGGSCSSQTPDHLGHQGLRQWANPLLPLILINKQMKQEINSLSIKLMPTLVFCSQPHAWSFFFRFNKLALPADMGAPSAYKIRKDIRFDSIYHHNGETVEMVKARVDRALEITLEEKFGIQDIPSSEREVTYLAEHERRFSWEPLQCMGTVGSDLRRLGEGSWRVEKKFRTKHCLCDRDECSAEDRNP
ncbi:uncharacterized protein AB675_12039 [Cyphellophora attinorum]|uniref:Uncharacterized protein n=1 Tax=Cyphellophora attinorum TaxID=1664694 RepID=A0A0N1H764_9EURO|nr:uncharacterized protein AB675_12039 [Phialophora attinorum]KPI38405.1 hypothetical protein AB675_12039 [Phialophora attinorum]